MYFNQIQYKYLNLQIMHKAKIYNTRFETSKHMYHMQIGGI